MQHLTPESLKQAGIEWDPAPFSDLRPKKEEEKEKEEAEEPKGKRKRKPKAPKITAWEVDRPVVEDDGTSGEPCCKTTLGESVLPQSGRMNVRRALLQDDAR